MNELNNKPLDLKYRPKDFSEVLGNMATINLVASLIKSGEFPKFSIFSGPPGCGKTTTAFIVAKALQCDTYNGRGICGHCPHCVGLEETLYETGKGNPSLGVNTFDMGLNTDEQYINDIAISVQSGSFSGKKVMIIEELQRTKKDAQESLLNTLEFIPDDVYIIVTTSELNKIIQALRTRAVDFRFNYPNTVELKNYTKEIVGKEKIKIKAEDIDVIIKQANNNPRQIMKSLETVQNSGVEGLNYIYELKTFDYERYFKYFESIESGLMETILFIEGLDSKVKFLLDLKYYIKDFIVAIFAPSTLKIKKSDLEGIRNNLRNFDVGLCMDILGDLTNLGYVTEADAGIHLLTIANKFNKGLFRVARQDDNLTPRDEIMEDLEPEIEVIEKSIKNRTGVINLSDL